MKRPRVSTILALIAKKEYSKALRTASNDTVDGYAVVKILLDYKNIYKPHVIDEQVGEKQRAAIHLAIIKENWDVADLLKREGASSSLEDLDARLPSHYLCT